MSWKLNPRPKANQRQAGCKQVEHDSRDGLAEEKFSASHRAMNQERPEVAMPFVEHLHPSQDRSKNRAKERSLCKKARGEERLRSLNEPPVIRPRSKIHKRGA